MAFLDTKRDRGCLPDLRARPGPGLRPVALQHRAHRGTGLYVVFAPVYRWLVGLE